MTLMQLPFIIPAPDPLKPSNIPFSTMPYIPILNLRLLWLCINSSHYNRKGICLRDRNQRDQDGVQGISRSLGKLGEGRVRRGLVSFPSHRRSTWVHPFPLRSISVHPHLLVSHPPSSPSLPLTEWCKARKNRVLVYNKTNEKQEDWSDQESESLEKRAYTHIVAI